MDRKGPVFSQVEGSDANLAAEIAERLGMALPRACEAGVAFHARLIQRHADVLREEIR